MAATLHPPPSGPSSANSPSSSRKRLHSGSRKPSTSATNVEDDGPLVATTKDLVLDQFITRDQNYSYNMSKDFLKTENIIEEIRDDLKWFRDFRNATSLDPGRIYGEGFAGYGNGWTAQYPSKLIYPSYRKRPGMRRTPELRVRKNDRVVQSDQFEELTPVRLEVEFEKLRLRDTFTWNAHDRTISPRHFAECLVEDLQIPQEAQRTFVDQVQTSIQEQIIDHHPHPWNEEEPLDPHLPYTAYKNDEMRIIIKLNVTIGQHALIDQFEWDINNKLNSPEEFAARLARDLSLSGEFTTAIAHQIREQTQLFTKSLYVTGHPFDGRPPEDPDVKDNLLPSPLPVVFRPYQAAKDYTPFFFELNAAELEKADSALSREQRSMKRSVNRRGGPAMPDLKDRFVQTVRTMVVSSVIPGAAESVQTSGVYKPARAATGRGRRPGWKTLGDDESDNSEEEDSDPDSPAQQATTQGTTRTRGIRGAAAAASVAMRAGYAGSMTPETEARTSRRFNRTIEDQEDSADEGRYILRLRMPRQSYREWWRNYKLGIRRQIPSSFMPPRPFQGMPPPNTPGAGNRALGQIQGGQQYSGQYARNMSRDGSTAGSPPYASTAPPLPFVSASGATITPLPPSSTQPAPPPPWLLSALHELRQTYPQDSFEPSMRWNNAVQEWQPKIKCNDCPGQVYKTQAPPADPTENFRVHLENRRHRGNVEARTGGAMS